MDNMLASVKDIGSNATTEAITFVKGLFHNRQITYGYASTRVRARKALILQKN
ncbi:MAG: hypothetical protein GY852_09185, partial [bacterium]|nr:hypothetical protein [bacterium]